MRSVALAAVVACAVSCWAQSLGDLVRADREKAKPHARKVITNDNLNDPASVPEPAPPAKPVPEPTDPLQRDLFRMRAILQRICADPRTDGGKNLSDDDKTAMNGGVKALRIRVLDFEKLDKKYKDALAALDQDFEAKIVKAVNTGQPFTDADLQRVKNMRLEHDARRAAILQQAEHDKEAYKTFQQDIDSVGNECPAAAASVPD